MFKQLEKLLQKQMSRKQFLATLGLGLVSIFGFAAVIRMLGDKALALQGPDATVTTADSFKHYNKILFKNGHVITMDSQLGNIAGGDVLIDKGKIVAVGEKLPRRGAKVIDATGMIVIPGFIDAHKHLWETLVRGISANATGRQHRDLVLDPLPAKLTAEDVYYGTLVGALDALENGTTTVLNWDLGSQTLPLATAAVNALVDAKIRALHSFSASYLNQNDPDGPPREDDFRALAELMSKHPLVSPHMGTRNPVNRGDEVLQRVIRDFNLARELGITISIHAGLPTSQATPGLLNAHGLLGPDLTLVNGSAFTDAEFALLAEHGSWVVTAPEVEMQSATPPPLGSILAAGMKPVVCTDSYAYTSSYMPTQMRMLAQSAREKGIGTTENGILKLEEVFPYGNVNPAASLGMSDSIGSLTPGKQADIVLVDTQESLSTLATVNVFSDLLQMSHPGNIDTVLVAGKVVKHRGELVGHNLRQLRRKLQKHQERLLAR